MNRFRFSFLVACFVHEDRCPSLTRANFTRVVLLRSSRPLLCERLQVLDADCESETGPRVEDAFDLASGATDRGLCASELTFGATSRPKDASSCGQKEPTKRNHVAFASSPVPGALVTDFAKQRMPCLPEIPFGMRRFHEATLSLTVCRRV